MAESTLMYYDMSTVVISSTAAASSLVSTAIMTNTPSPTSNIEPPDMEEMENNAVIMAFNNLTLLQVSHFDINFVYFAFNSGCN